MNDMVSKPPFPVMCRQPEVGLITSWCVGCPQPDAIPPGLVGMTSALQEGVTLLDLYFLNHIEIPFYKALLVYRNLLMQDAASRKTMIDQGISPCLLDESRNEPSQLLPALLTELLAKVITVPALLNKLYPLQQKLWEATEPQAFVAEWSKEQVNYVARYLQAELTRSYRGRVIGRRPRFGAIATFFPGVSIPPLPDINGKITGAIEQRRQAVRALRNTLYLAHLLGCSVVEADGGSGVPEPDSKLTMSPTAYRDIRIVHLAESLEAIYCDEAKETNEYGINPLEEIEQPPRIALELEPGVSFLLQNSETFLQVRERVKERYRSYIRLNADLAHFFLIGYHHPDDLGTAHKYIAHMHISDHAGDSRWGGVHASDLPPGQFHYEDAYAPWLRFAAERANNGSSDFSGIVSVEMEACNSVEDVLAAVRLTRRWIEKAMGFDNAGDGGILDNCFDLSGVKAETYEGALMVIDLGASTLEMFGRPLADSAEGAWTMQQIIDPLFQTVRDRGGSVMSFTGDGLIAIFEQRQLQEEASLIALETAGILRRVIEQTVKRIQQVTYEQARAEAEQRKRSEFVNLFLTLRTSLHWGRFTIPTRGSLRDKVVGKEVVRVCRLCNFLSKKIEPDWITQAPSSLTPYLIGISKDFYDQLPDEKRQEWEYLEEAELSGLEKTIIYVRQEDKEYIQKARAAKSERPGIISPA